MLEGAKEAVASAGRVMFGVEPGDMSFLYYLMYIQAAGGIEPLISADKNSGQEFKVKVIIDNAYLTKRIR